MEDQTSVTLVLAQERNLIADTEFNVLGNMTVGLGEGLKIKIIPDTVLYAETDVVTCLLTAGSLCPVEERQPVVMTEVLVITCVIVTGRIDEI